MLFNSYVALDITDSNIRITTIKRNKIEKSVTSPLPDNLIKTGIIQESQALGVFIDTLFKDLKLNRDKVICTLTGLPFIYRTINMPGNKYDISPEAVEREAKREMSISTEDIYLLWQATSTNKEVKETEYFVLGIPRSSLDPLVDALNIAHIKPYLIDIKPLAIARAAAMQNALIVSLEKNYFDVVVVVGGLVRVIHSINPSIDPEDVVSNVNEIVDGLNKAIKSFNREFPQNALPDDTPIVVCGELASNGEIIRLVQESTGHPTGVIKLKCETPPETPPIVYASNIGLAAKTIQKFTDSVNYQDINVNLYHGIKKPAKFKFKLSYAFAAMLVIIAVALLYWAYDAKSGADQQVSSLKPQADKVAQQLVAAQKSNKEALAAKKVVEDKLQALNAQLNNIRNENQILTSQQLDYATRVEGITDVVTGNTRLEAIDMQLPVNILNGTAKVSGDVTNLADALEKNALFLNARIVSIEPNEDATVNFTMNVANSNK